MSLINFYVTVPLIFFSLIFAPVAGSSSSDNTIDNILDKCSKTTLDQYNSIDFSTFQNTIGQYVECQHDEEKSHKLGVGPVDAGKTSKFENYFNMYALPVLMGAVGLIETAGTVRMIKDTKNNQCQQSPSAYIMFAVGMLSLMADISGFVVYAMNLSQTMSEMKAGDHDASRYFAIMSELNKLELGYIYSSIISTNLSIIGTMIGIMMAIIELVKSGGSPNESDIFCKPDISINSSPFKVDQIQDLKREFKLNRISRFRTHIIKLSLITNLISSFVINDSKANDERPIPASTPEALYKMVEKIPDYYKKKANSEFNELLMFENFLDELSMDDLFIGKKIRNYLTIEGEQFRVLNIFEESKLLILIVESQYDKKQYFIKKVVSKLKLSSKDKIKYTTLLNKFEDQPRLIKLNGGEVVKIKGIKAGDDSVILIVRSQKDKRDYAIAKPIFLNQRTRNNYTRYETLLDNLNHENIIKLKKGDQNVLILEHGGDTLQNYIKRLGHRSNPLIRRHILKSLLEGISYLHSMGVLHNDLHLDNILVSDEKIPKVRIIDIGASEILPYRIKGLTDIKDLRVAVLTIFNAATNLSPAEKSFYEYINSQVTFDDSYKEEYSSATIKQHPYFSDSDYFRKYYTDKLQRLMTEIEFRRESTTNRSLRESYEADIKEISDLINKADRVSKDGYPLEGFTEKFTEINSRYNRGHVDLQNLQTKIREYASDGKGIKKLEFHHPQTVQDIKKSGVEVDFEYTIGGKIYKVKEILSADKGNLIVKLESLDSGHNHIAMFPEGRKMVDPNHIDNYIKNRYILQQLNHENIIRLDPTIGGFIISERILGKPVKIFEGHSFDSRYILSSVLNTIDYLHSNKIDLGNFDINDFIFIENSEDRSRPKIKLVYHGHPKINDSVDQIHLNRLLSSFKHIAADIISNQNENSLTSADKYYLDTILNASELDDIKKLRYFVDENFHKKCSKGAN